MRQQFYQSLKIGEAWETTMEQWMAKYFAKTKWIVEDARHVHRDEDGDQFPDYLLVNSETDKFCFIDAKKRNAYVWNEQRYFGFDERFFNSYTNIAKKHNTKVYVGFNDPAFDPNHVYILDVSQPHDWKPYFSNVHGSSHAYRWKVEHLVRLEM